MMLQLMNIRQPLQIIDTAAKVSERMTKDHQMTII